MGYMLTVTTYRSSRTVRHATSTVKGKTSDDQIAERLMSTARYDSVLR